MGDPQFPQVAKEETDEIQIRLWRWLYEHYSHLDLSNDYDRPLAIAGLERRLCRAFETDGGFGLFTRWLQYGLLWHRDGVQSLDKIRMPHGRKPVPSWSWMAYRGSIRFLDLPFDEVEWTESEYRSPFDLTTSNTGRNARSVRDGATSVFQVKARSFDLKPMDESETRPTIIWDGREVPDGTLKCVVIGKLRVEEDMELPTQMHYVLILRQADQLDTFERVGVACLTKDRIDLRASPAWSLVR